MGHEDRDPRWRAHRSRAVRSPLLSYGFMSLRAAAACCAALIMVGAVASCERAPRAPALVDGRFTPAEVARLRAMALTQARAPHDATNLVSGDEHAALLGQGLFFDRRLSRDDSVSCASCHDPSHGFSLEQRLGKGMAMTARHPPTLLNVSLQQWFDWDGKADSLWSQAARPLESPDEHGVTRVDIARRLVEDPNHRLAYERAFGERLPEPEQIKELWPARSADRTSSIAMWETLDGQTRAQIEQIFVRALKSIAAYQEQLISVNAPFDRYVHGLTTGDDQALGAISEGAKDGLVVFLRQGRCVQCHNGPTFSDQAFHNLGLPVVDGVDPQDEGRWEGVEMVLQSELNARGVMSDAQGGARAQWLRYLKRTREDHGQFKTPTLRNVTLTAPYMHGGHFETLRDVLVFYNTLPDRASIGHREEALRPLGLSPDQLDDLEAFLRTLEGEAIDERCSTLLTYRKHLTTERPHTVGDGARTCIVADIYGLSDFALDDDVEPVEELIDVLSVLTHVAAARSRDALDMYAHLSLMVG